MPIFKAGVQYGDWHGTAAADDADVGANSIERLLEQKGQKRDDEYLIAASLWVGETRHEKIDFVSISAYLFKGTRYEEVEQALLETKGRIRVREVEVTLSLDDFVALFKQFSVMLTAHDLPLEGREFDTE